MPKADNRLSGARNLGVLGAAPLGLGDKFKPTDTETLYRFGLDKSSSFNLALSGLAKKTNADVELYRFKRSANEVISLMGNLDFQFVSGSSRDANLQLVGASKRKGNKSENLALSSLEAGDYAVRVLGRSGKSRYSLQVAATAISSPVVDSNKSVVVPVKIIASSGDTIAPTATLNAANFVTEGSTTYDFTVTYSDNVAVNVSSLDSSDVLVTGPNGFSQLATKVIGSDSSNGVAATATYRITAPVGTWSLAENGSYSVALQANQVSDSNGNFTPATSLGSFLMNTPLRGLKHSGTSNGPMASHFTFDFDPASGSLRRFGLMIYYDGVAIPEVYDSVQLELVKNTSGGITTEEINNLKNWMPATKIGQSRDGFGVRGLASIGVYSSEIIYRAKLGSGSDASGKPTTALILGIKTSNPDRSNPMALLKTALDGETLGAEIFGIYTGVVSQSFDFTTTPSASLDRLATLQILPDGSRAYDFQVTYSDNVAIDVSSIDDNDIEIGGQLAKKVAVSSNENGTPITVTYRILGDSSVELTNWNGVESYFIVEDYLNGKSGNHKLRGNQVKDVNGNFMPASTPAFTAIDGSGRYGLYLPLNFMG